MSGNMRPALHGSRHEVLAPDRPAHHHPDAPDRSASTVGVVT
ncbi:MULTISPECIES: hypothetical protein [unclassified Streptomyces]